MHPEEIRKLRLLLLIMMPTLCWLLAVKHTEILHAPKWKSLWELLKHTHEKPVLLVAFLSGLGVATLLSWLVNHFGKSEFTGAYYKKFLRGTRIVSSTALKRTVIEKQQQVTVAGIPLPSSLETLHLLVAGATGSGKSVLMRSTAFSALQRGDWVIVLDPNGDMYSKFGRDTDVLLNPYDARTKGWSFFNEIRTDYDFNRYALSLVPRGKTADAEEWAAFGRLLLCETARKLALLGTPSVEKLHHWTTIASPEALREFLQGTLAESLFVGSSEATKALSSARFVLADKLPEHVRMPAGEFSLRNWLEDDRGGNLFITWREDMAEALKPLISAWIDALFVSILSMPEDKNRRIWAFIDELASLEKLASLESALTKGRKHGLRVVAGLQSTAQLDDIYGRDAAQTLRSCFRSLVVLGGAKTDPKTCEDMSKSLGEHEVEREHISKSSGGRGSVSNTSLRAERERVVSPSEIASLPDLTGYVAFAGDHAITKVKLEVQQFLNRIPAFEERGL